MLGIFHPLQVAGRFLFGPRFHERIISILNFFLMRCINILGSTYHFANFIPLPIGQPIIFVCNHQSMWDVPPLFWKFRKHRLKFVAKMELSKYIPSISYNLRVGGSVAIDRKDPEGAIKKITEFAKWVKENNCSICIFPEGTRSKDGEVQEFKTQGLEAILGVIPNAFIVPIVVQNTGRIDVRGQFTKRLGIKVYYSQLAARQLSPNKLREQINSIQKEMALTASKMG
jgi:1-acyl-sn-glycerol-3-phosphate acyltransferase